MRLLRQRNVELQCAEQNSTSSESTTRKNSLALPLELRCCQGRKAGAARYPNILLSHNPIVSPSRELGIELSLAGHTHGGQIQIEIVDRRWSPARFMTSYVAGLYSFPRRRWSKGRGEQGMPLREPRFGNDRHSDTARRPAGNIIVTLRSA